MAGATARHCRLGAFALTVTLWPVPRATAQARDSGARMERVADGVYAIVHDDATDEWPHGNTGVVVSDHGVLVIDATYLASRARADIALIRSITSQPVRYLVYTHWHFDHTNGAIAYAKSVPRPDGGERTGVAGFHRPEQHLVGKDVHRLRFGAAEVSGGAAMARKGMTLDQIQNAIGLDDIRRRTPPWQPRDLDADWTANLKTLVERAWRGVRGQGG